MRQRAAHWYPYGSLDGKDRLVEAPRIAGKIEGLHAVNSRTCLDVTNQQIHSQNLRLGDLYSHLHALFLSETRIHLLDPDLRPFINLNTPDSLSQAQRNSASPLG